MLFTPVSFLVAFTAGLISFLSPCVLPLVPSFLSYLAGTTVAELGRIEAKDVRITVAMRAFLFVTGFSIIFILLGLSASAIGALFLKYQALLRKLSGLIVIIFGLHMAGILKLKVLNLEKRINFQPRKVGPLGAFLLGMAFSAGWTPCIGPVLGSILVLAGNSASLSAGAYLLAAYSLGLGIPFLVTALFWGWLAQGLKRYGDWMPRLVKGSGWVLVGAGLLILTGNWGRLASWLTF
ncbi:cytochrome c-type biogenesis protein [Thermanaeromonas toyohensis ToBE]|uniref:Cytochrome c-type biogenesis protein n=1 Tax=Thermanaeromonas toyohensis ToBE TaxID=698762 RepID=A0A1W1VZP5_9FIRM|nr:cytochrome c biogenesis protein CcdA [Thermanaeromonas toyohensis]SMB98730.1 cytochrome c-type biogenesis protein [Thermanaeromonas toyohensis ToBE]